MASILLKLVGQLFELLTKPLMEYNFRKILEAY